MMVLKAIAVWLGILGLAITNGAVRESVLLKNFDRSVAFTLSGVLLIAAILLVAALSVPWIGRRPLAHFLWLGLFSLVLLVLTPAPALVAWARGMVERR